MPEVLTPTHVTVRGHWRREIDGVDELGVAVDRIPIDGEHRPRYYWRRLRVPWLAWVMFS